jgi:alkylhydroperoxidase family enzyme
VGQEIATPGWETGRTAVHRAAPDVAPVLDRLQLTVWIRTEPDLAALTADAVATPHGLPPLGEPLQVAPSARCATGTPWRTLDLDERRRAALRFADQFSVDVAAMDDEIRDALHAQLGDVAFEYAQSVFVLDVVGRARALLDALFGASTAPDPAVALNPYPSIWAGVEELLVTVPGLTALDPITTDLARLRLARHHDCRLCRSLRSRSALAEGADEALFDATQEDRPEGLDSATLAALELVDAFAWTPGRVDPGVLSRVRRHFSAPQQVELVVDAARNAANKLAVAFGADAPHVDSGVEIFDVALDGTVTYGLDPPPPA